MASGSIETELKKAVALKASCISQSGQMLKDLI